MRNVIAAGVILSAAALVFAQAPASSPATQPAIESPEHLLELVAPPKPVPAGWEPPAFGGRRVEWIVEVFEVGAAKDGKAMVVAYSPTRKPVTWYAPVEAAKQLAKVAAADSRTQVGAMIKVCGVIDDYTTDKIKPRKDAPRYSGVLLTDVTHVPADKVFFFGARIDADDIVFVTDRSGSMLDKFEYIKRDLTKALGCLQASRRFSLVFFDEGRFQAIPADKLVDGTDAQRKDALEKLDLVRPTGRTDPVPAIERAVAMLATPPMNRTKAMVLLTDAAFPKNDAVERALFPRVKTEKIRLYTFLYGHDQPDAAKFMEKLAREGNGRFKQIVEEE